MYPVVQPCRFIMHGKCVILYILVPGQDGQDMIRSLIVQSSEESKAEVKYTNEKHSHSISNVMRKYTMSSNYLKVLYSNLQVKSAKQLKKNYGTWIFLVRLSDYLTKKIFPDDNHVYLHYLHIGIYKLFLTYEFCDWMRTYLSFINIICVVGFSCCCRMIILIIKYNLVRSSPARYIRTISEAKETKKTCSLWL